MITKVDYFRFIRFSTQKISFLFFTILRETYFEYIYTYIYIYACLFHRPSLVWYIKFVRMYAKLRRTWNRATFYYNDQSDVLTDIIDNKTFSLKTYKFWNFFDFIQIWKSKKNIKTTNLMVSQKYTSNKLWKSRSEEINFSSSGDWILLT